jgi:hypothetical protein
MNTVVISRFVGINEYLELIEWLLQHQGQYRGWDICGVLCEARLIESREARYFVPGNLTIRCEFDTTDLAVLFKLKFS